MSDNINLKRGLNIPIKGVAAQQLKKVIVPDVVALKPTDFRCLVPKLLVHEGDRVLAGSPVMADKADLSILFTSPVSGTVKEIVRGEKRKLLEVRIEADKTVEYVDFGIKDPVKMSAGEIREALLASGLWPGLVQRPYGIIAKPQATPKAIFVSSFSTAPLANEISFSLKGESDNLQAGIDALSKLTDGGVHVSFDSKEKGDNPFRNLRNITAHYFSGPHPAGNVGIQIHHISPVAKGETVWTVAPHILAAMGRLFRTGKLDLRRKVAVTGPKATEPSYVESVAGFCMKAIADMCEGGDVRYISGDALTGTNVGKEGFLGFFDDQVTVLAEGHYHEMFGWGKPFRTKKFSFSHTYFSWLTPNRKYTMDTNLNGGVRAFVMSDIYSKVLPMQLYPVYLVKACMAQDIDKMERFGIYEVLPEDFALCEYICPSKIEIQSILEDGISLMMKEMA